ncbi:MAG: acyltransferase family protein, partial [Ilumatobacteraceae bacterium]
MASDKQSRTPRDLGRDVSALNGIRGLAILQVVLAHTHYLVNSDPQAVYMTNSWFVNRIFEPGYLGLDLFFVLSGFLISSLLLRDLADRSAGSGKRTTTLRYFYARRALRLLPALYVMLALDWVFVLISGDVSLHTQWRTTYSAVFYIANWATVWNLPATNPDLGHLWSLAVEEQFYIVWPLVILGLT